MITDGPFIESKEQIGGFSIMKAPDLDAALGWGRKLARAIGTPIEVRPFMEGALSGAADRIERSSAREYGRAVAVLIRFLGDIDARRGGGAGRVPRRRVQRWPPTASRRARRLDHHHGAEPGHRPSAARGPRDDRHAQAALLSCATQEPVEEHDVRDDRLRLIFTCCHPALAPEAQVALTLRLLGGLTTAEIARAFLRSGADDGAAAVARESQDPRRRHSVPGAARRSCPRACAPCSRSSIWSSTRATARPRAISWSAPTCATRRIRLGRLLAELLPDEPERSACWR